MTEEAFAEGRNKIEEEKRQLIAEAKTGIKTNIPLKPVQKKYLKNMLLFSIMRASADEKYPGNLKSKASALFKKMLISILIAKKMIKDGYSDEDEENDEDFFNENILISMNNIELSPKVEKVSFMRWLTPKNIMLQIRFIIMGFTSRDVVKRLKSIKNANTNHRETPEEILERKRRGRALTVEKKRMLQQEYQRQEEMWRQYSHTHNRGRN